MDMLNELDEIIDGEVETPCTADILKVCDDGL